MGNRFVMVKPNAPLPTVRYKPFVKTRSSYEPIVTGEALFSFGRVGQGELTMWAKERFYYQTPLEMLDVPVDEILSVSAGYDHALFLTKQGDVYAFGDNKFGCLGYSLEETDFVDHFHVPRQVPNLEDKHIASVHASSNLSAALSRDGALYTWGFPGSYFTGTGALGRRTSKKDFHFPKRVSEDIRFKSVALGEQQMVGLAVDGKVWRWGKFPGGKDCLLPQHVAVDFPVRQTACDGEGHLVLLDEHGQVHSSAGGRSVDELAPVANLKDIVQIACGHGKGHLVALDAFGQVFHTKSLGQKRGEFALLGGDILGHKITQIACGANFACAVSDGGRTYAWGDFAAYKHGALGSGSVLERRLYFDADVPKPVATLERFACSRVVCGRTFALALGIKQ